MPRDYPSLPDHVFRNDGGRFIDVRTESGFVDPDGRGLGVVAADLDDDNKIDLYVANDMSANYLFHNTGSFRFEEIGHAAGAAASADGLYKSGMGIACGDLNGDGTLDLAVTNFFGESTTFFQNYGRGLLVDSTALIGLQAPSRPLLGFGIAFADVNNDGWLDLLSTNGHVFDARPRFPWTMPLQLLLGGPGGFLTDVSDRSGEPFGPLHLGRGLAIGDLDNDGRVDSLVLNQNEPLVYLHNRTAKPGHFIRFSLEGTQSNRDAVGARRHDRRWRPAPHGRARRWWQLSIGERSAASFWPGSVSSSRVGGGALALGTGRSPRGIGGRPGVSAARRRAAARGHEHESGSLRARRTHARDGFASGPGPPKPTASRLDLICVLRFLARNALSGLGRRRTWCGIRGTGFAAARRRKLSRHQHNSAEKPAHELRGRAFHERNSFAGGLISTKALLPVWTRPKSCWRAGQAFILRLGKSLTCSASVSRAGPTLECAPEFVSRHPS